MEDNNEPTHIPKIPTSYSPELMNMLTYMDTVTLQV